MAEEKMHTGNIGVIILAAGASSRLGTPKQLLFYYGNTLVQHACEAAINANAGAVTVVLGANAGLIQEALNNNAAHTVINTGWQEGIASSIRHGIKTFTQLNPLAEAVVLLLADQPYVTTASLKHLITTYQATGKHIVASAYGDSFGTPALFHKNIFPELLQLTGDAGAKSIIRRHLNEGAFIPFPEGNIDVDTAEDYRKLIG